MRIRVGIAVMALVGGLVVGCGGGQAATTRAPTTSTTAPTTTTTTTITTTTTSTTTTTTTTVPESVLKPWTVVPVPDPFDVGLTDGFGGPITIDSICLDVRVDGVLRINEIIDWVSEPLDLLGIQHAYSGCDATLVIEWSGSRSSARYETIGTCWTGWHLRGGIALLVDGTLAGTVSADLDRPPPNAVGGCVEADRDLPWQFWGRALTEVLVGAFGPQAALAAVAPYEDGLRSAPEDAEWRYALEPAVEVLENETVALEALIGGLFHPDDRVFDLAEDVIRLHVPLHTDEWEPSSGMMAAVPQLIAALDHLNQANTRAQGLTWAMADLVFRDDPIRVTDIDEELGMGRECPAHWWLAWQGKMQRGAPCDELAAP